MALPTMKKHVTISYLNHKGVLATYEVEPVGLTWGTTRYDRQEEQWLFMAIDKEDGILKSFSLHGLLRGQQRIGREYAEDVTVD